MRIGKNWAGRVVEGTKAATRSGVADWGGWRPKVARLRLSTSPGNLGLRRLNAFGVEETGAEVGCMQWRPFLMTNDLGSIMCGRVHRWEAERGGLENPPSEFIPRSVRRTRRHLPSGPVVKMELTASWGDTVDVELTRERFLVLELKRDDQVFVTLKEMKVFAEDYVI
ncbi:MAG: hypothetical protein WC655_10800 [Candidatus Hydrogenedentales bacterium]